MIKAAYFLSFLAITSFISCKKKVVYPTPAPKTVTKDTLSGNIYTIAGNGNSGYSGDGGPATLAEIGGPAGVIVDGSGNIYISSNNCVRKVNTNGVISTIAGNGVAGYSGDGGPATLAELYYPYGVVIDGLGNIYIADYNNMRVRIVNPVGVISTIAGIGYFSSYDYSGDGGPASAAETGYSQSIGLDNLGNLYIADLYVNRIRKVYK